MTFQLTEQQHAAVFDRGGGMLVSAAAGSGKTRVLVERLLARVEEGADIDRFLVITYTRAAAAELRGRIAGEISQRLTERPGDAMLRRQATLVYKAQISTIDAFCTQFLREEGHRLELDHDFRLCDENEGQMVLENVLEEVLERRYEMLTPGDDFELLVNTMSNGRDDSRLAQIVVDIRRRIQSHPAPALWLDQQEEAFALRGIGDVGETVWGQLLLEDARRQAGYWAGQLEGAAALCEADGVLMATYAPAIWELHGDLAAFSAAAEEGWDAARQRVISQFPRFKAARKCEDPETQERVKAIWEQAKKRLKRLFETFLDDSGTLMEDMASVYPAIRGLFALVRDVEEAFSAEKRRRGMLDFSDLEHMAARLLADDEGRPTELARRWSGRYDEVMVDEYQDTNAVQNALFNALSDGGRKLFLVGDVKQSIYRFRLADPTIFLGKYRDYAPWEEAEAGEERRVILSKNFRSRVSVLEGCNYIFRNVMSEEFGEMDYTDAEALYAGREFPGREEDYRVELNALDCSAGDGEEAAGEPVARDLIEARFAARRISELLEEGFPVFDGEGGLRPVRPEDMVILLRSPGTVLHHYAQALGERDIPWQAEGREEFFGATEIQVALSLLKIIDNPRQDVPLIAVLRSAVYAFSADRLAQIRLNAPKGDFYTALTLDKGEDVQAFLMELAGLRRQAGDAGCDRLLWELYDRTNLLGLYAALDEGEMRRSNLLLLAQLAREFEQGGHKGLFDFLTYLQRLEEKEYAPAQGEEQGTDGVRIMSIHRSKGLEFPVVFLSGMARQFNRTDQTQPMLFHPRLGVGPKGLDPERMIEYSTLARRAVARQMDREMMAEELRLLYVAMTRAQEKLILTCALTGGERDIEKLMPMAGAPVEPQALLDCASMAQWVLLPVLARPEGEVLRRGYPQPTVAAKVDLGLPWDLRWVEGDVFRSRPAPHRREAVTEEEMPERLEDCLFWEYPYLGDVELPSKLTATQLKGRDLDEEAAEEAPREAAPPRFDRPRFASEKLGLTAAEKGTALHLVMQYINFDRCGSKGAVAEEIERLVRERFITSQQAESVEPERIAGFFASPLGQEMMKSGTLRREFKFSVLAPARRYYPEAGEGEQVLLQGVVDCYFETPKGITVVDFKTDRVYGEGLTARAEEYRPQLAAYADALGEITGKPVVRRALWFFSEGKAVEV